MKKGAATMFSDDDLKLVEILAWIGIVTVMVLGIGAVVGAVAALISWLT